MNGNKEIYTMLQNWLRFGRCNIGKYVFVLACLHFLISCCDKIQGVDAKPSAPDVNTGEVLAQFEVASRLMNGEADADRTCSMSVEVYLDEKSIYRTRLDTGEKVSDAADWNSMVTKGKSVVRVLLICDGEKIEKRELINNDLVRIWNDCDSSGFKNISIRNLSIKDLEKNGIDFRLD